MNSQPESQAADEFKTYAEFYNTWVRCESTRGCYSTCPAHDSRCPKDQHPEQRCTCGRDKLEALENEILKLRSTPSLPAAGTGAERPNLKDEGEWTHRHVEKDGFGGINRFETEAIFVGGKELSFGYTPEQADCICKCANRIVADLHSRMEQAERQVRDGDDFLAYMTDELAKWPCCCQDKGHECTPPMMWPELIACIVKKAVSQAEQDKEDLIRVLDGCVHVLAACSDSAKVLQGIDKSGGWKKADQAIADTIRKAREAIDSARKQEKSQ